ncbi:MAG: SH3 domain-containing protein [Spirochaetes bacterium]|nr:SH3 domain-containing protein [Spirochaetota bacterium]
MRYRIFFLIVLLSFNFCSKKKNISIEDDPSIAQEIILINQEFESGNYEKVINFINEFFEKYELNDSNAKLLVKKAQTYEAIVEQANKIRSKDEKKKIAKRYHLDLVQGDLDYDGEDLVPVWKKFPNSEIGKISFDQWFETRTNISERISSLEKYIKGLNDKAKWQLALSELYIQKFISNSKKYSLKLLELSDQIMRSKANSTEKAEAFINKNIILLKQQEDLDRIYKNLEGFESRSKFYLALKYYILAQIALSRDRLDKAKEYFEKAVDFLRKAEKKKADLPALLVNYEDLPDSTKATLQKEIAKKIQLVKYLLRYNKKLKDKKMAYVLGKRVRVRKDPSVRKKNVITSLNYGDKVIVVERSDTIEEINGEKNYWYKVELKDGITGWIFGKYLTLFLVNEGV